MKTALIALALVAGLVGVAALGSHTSPAPAAHSVKSLDALPVAAHSTATDRRVRMFMDDCTSELRGAVSADDARRVCAEKLGF